MKGLHYQTRKIKKLENLSLWQRLNSFLKFKRVSLNQTSEFPLWGINIF